jgi:hypothetical protein
MHIKERGWTDGQTLLSLILLNLAGGDSVDDLEVLEKDKGFCSVLDRIKTKGLTRKNRRDQERRWRKTTHRAVPSPSAIFRILQPSMIPKKRRSERWAEPLSLEPMRVNRDFIGSVQHHRPTKEATLDMDATVIATQKDDELNTL